MSAIAILAPVVITAWPAFGAAVVAAAASMGYVVSEEAVTQVMGGRSAVSASRQVSLEIPRSEVVTDGLGRDQRIAVTRDGVTVEFSRDARGKASLCVKGEGRTEAELQALGTELSQRVVQQYVYKRVMDEMQRRQFHVVEEEVDQNQAIHLRIRHWEN